MIQFGARRGCADLMNESQSSLFLGANSLVPRGQLILSLLRRTSLQLTHFTMGPGEYGPFMVTRSHLHDAGLPAAGSVETSATPVHSLASTWPFAKIGRGVNSAFLYAAVVGYKSGTSHFTRSGSLGYLMFRWSVLCVAALHASISLFSTLPSLKALMMQCIRFKPLHSALRSISSCLTVFSAVS